MTRVVLLLPEYPQPGSADAFWWRVEAGVVTASGEDASWVELSVEGGSELVALAPAGAVRLVVTEPVGATDRQAAAIAAAAAREASAADGSALHAVATMIGAGEERRSMAAVVAAGVVERWLEWLGALGRDPEAIVPSQLLLPAAAEWTDLRVGNEHLVGRGDLRFPYEPALAEALIGEERVRRLGSQEVEAALVRLAEATPLDLRQGPFARRRSVRIEQRQWRELAALAACVPLLALAAALVTVVRVNGAADRLDRQTEEVASAALGRSVAAEQALTELDLQAARLGGAGGTLAGPMAALFQQMQADPSVTATALGWRGDGTLSTTLAAARVEDINRLLIALQRNGYKVTAVPRSAADGRQMADITVRSGA